MRRTRLRSTCFWALILLAGVVPSLSGANEMSATGTLQGTLTVTAPPRPKTSTTSSGGGFFYDEDDSATTRNSPPEEVVVYLEGVPGHYPPPKQHAQLDQKFLQFTHRVLPVLKGTMVDFTNHDPVYHNVFSNSHINAFDLGRRGKGQKAYVKMLKAEIPVNVYCEIHASMKSDILVLENPFFTTVSPGGRFKIEGIPSGTYRMVAWHDYWKPVEREVTIGKGTTTQASVTLSEVQK